MKGKIDIYLIEQKFPNCRGSLSWFESGDEYDTRAEVLDRLRELKMDGKSGFRAIKKTILVEVISELS